MCSFGILQFQLMGNWLNNYFSHRSVFYDLFNQSSKNLVEIAVLLVSIVDTDSFEERESLFNKISALEECGDDITHKIHIALDKIHFTPLNRKDIHVLASVMDDVADHIQEATGRMQLYNVYNITAPMKEMAHYILKAVNGIEMLTLSLNPIKNRDELIVVCKQIKGYEHQTDLIYYKALAELFAVEKNAINLLKNRDILYSLETAANKCKSVADAIETIIINSI